jgi:DNA-binding IclR family transcriptional regulator
MASDPYPGTQAVLRAITLLKAFTGARPELSLTDLARRARLNKTTAYRLITALESEGLVMRNPATDAYRLGPQMIALGGHAMRANDLHFASHLELDALAQATGETATLEVLAAAQGGAPEEVLILLEVVGRHVLGASQYVGTRWPAATTSTGKVLLAHQPADLLARMALPDALRQELPAIRQQGYAIADGDLEAGYLAIGAPVRSHEGGVLAAISIGGPSSRLNPCREILIRQVMGAARRISERLGYDPEGNDEF